jgi:hypothetical protein
MLLRAFRRGAGNGERRAGLHGMTLQPASIGAGHFYEVVRATPMNDSASNLVRYIQRVSARTVLITLGTNVNCQCLSETAIVQVGVFFVYLLLVDDASLLPC